MTSRELKRELAKRRELHHEQECPAFDWDADPDSCTCGVTAIYDEVHALPSAPEVKA